MRVDPLRIVILGLSITSSWGNGHATTFRSLTRALARRGHQLLFLERDVPWYAQRRDLPDPPYCPTRLYGSLDELRDRHGDAVASADLVVVGSYVPEGAAVGAWVCDTARGVSAFYDIDTPVTLRALTDGSCEYLTSDLLRRYDLYLSFAGGPVLEELECIHGARMPRPLYCCTDPDLYRADGAPPPAFELGYMGTYSPDRQTKLERLLVEPARRRRHQRFLVAGPLYPEDTRWPENVAHRSHVPPAEHPAFYTAQRYTLNLTRADMVALGHAPSVRLFEAAACGTPVISDYWEGLDAFFKPGVEILVADSADDVLRILTDVPESRRRAIGAAARERVRARHSAAHRALELEGYVAQCLPRRQRRSA